QLADRLDCFLDCGCTEPRVIIQILLDKILYDVDRAIDLYALGTDNFGIPERRAAAYSYVIQGFGELLADTTPKPPPNPGDSLITNLRTSCQAFEDHDRLHRLLDDIQTLLRHRGRQHDEFMQQELNFQRLMERQWRDLVETMAPDCTNPQHVFRIVETVIENAISDAGVSTEPVFTVAIPPHYETTLADIDRRIGP